MSVKLDDGKPELANNMFKPTTIIVKQSNNNTSLFL